MLTPVCACASQDVIGKRKQDKTHAATKLNLAEYSNEDGTDLINLPLKFKKFKETATLVVMLPSPRDSCSRS